MFRHTEEHQLPLLWWCALSEGRAPGLPVRWLWPIMLFAQTLFLIGLHPLAWQRAWGNAFEVLGYCSLLLFYSPFVYWLHISTWSVISCEFFRDVRLVIWNVYVVFCPKIDSTLCKGIDQHQSFPWSLTFHLHVSMWQTFISNILWDLHIVHASHETHDSWRFHNVHCSKSALPERISWTQSEWCL